MVTGYWFIAEQGSWFTLLERLVSKGGRHYSCCQKIASTIPVPFHEVSR